MNFFSLILKWFGSYDDFLSFGEKLKDESVRKN